MLKDIMRQVGFIFYFLLVMHTAVFLAYAVEDINEDLTNNGEYVELMI